MANMAKDAFYLNFKSDDDFFELPHFIWLCAAVDADLKRRDYDLAKQAKWRVRMNKLIELPENNYVTETAKVEKGIVALKSNIFSFSNDSSSLGLSRVYPKSGSSCSDFVRISGNEQWATCDIKDVVMFVQEGDNKVKLINYEICNPEEVTVRYVPEITETGSVANDRAFVIVTQVVAFLQSTSKGTVIDMINNSNNNRTIQTETDINAAKTQGG